MGSRAGLILQAVARTFELTSEGLAFCGSDAKLLLKVQNLHLVVLEMFANLVTDFVAIVLMLKHSFLFTGEISDAALSPSPDVQRFFDCGVVAVDGDSFSVLSLSSCEYLASADGCPIALELSKYQNLSVHYFSDLVGWLCSRWFS